MVRSGFDPPDPACAAQSSEAINPGLRTGLPGGRSGSQFSPICRRIRAKPVACVSMEKPVKILLVEDSPVDSRLLQLLLGESKTMYFAWTCVTRLADALAKLRDDHFDVVLSDLTLPDSQGFETFQSLRAQAPYMPIIVLSGTDDETMAIKAVREGAQDYLVKGKADTHVL